MKCDHAHYHVELVIDCTGHRVYYCVWSLCTYVVRLNGLVHKSDSVDTE
jgi:hypothetical protein